jgi:hypothetical protein
MVAMVRKLNPLALDYQIRTLKNHPKSLQGASILE